METVQIKRATTSAEVGDLQAVRHDEEKKNDGRKETSGASQENPSLFVVSSSQLLLLCLPEDALEIMRSPRSAWSRVADSARLLRDSEKVEQ